MPPADSVIPSTLNHIPNEIGNVFIFAEFHLSLQTPEQLKPPGVMTGYLLPLPDLPELLRAAAEDAREEKEPFVTVPPLVRAVALWIRATAGVVIGVLLFELGLDISVSSLMIMDAFPKWRTRIERYTYRCDYLSALMVKKFVN